MRPRDFGRVASAAGDVLIIGGGMYGLTIARASAARGLRTTLIDADDFGSGSSFGQKLLHGGLPALRRGQIGRARRAIRDRRDFARLAPWLLRPIPVIVGTYRSVVKSRLALRTVFKIDGWLGRHRNVAVEPELHLPAARLVSRAATVRLFPGLREEGLTGGAQWYDYQVVENERLIIALAAAAEQTGAELVNHVEAIGAVRENGRIAGMNVRDVLTGQESEIRASLVINAAGGAASALLAAVGTKPSWPTLRALTVVTTKRAMDIALAAPSADGRVWMVIPWQGRAIIGTRFTPAARDGAQSQTIESDLHAFVEEANRAFPALSLRREEIALVQSGLVPATEHGGQLTPLPAPRIIDHGGAGADGVITVLGGEYTAARRTADQLVALVGRKLGRRLRSPSPAVSALPGAGIADHEALAIETARTLGIELPLPLIRHLIGRYAEHTATIVRLMAAEPALGQSLPDRLNVAAEIVYAIRHESAVRLGDIVIRRLGLGATERPSNAVLYAAAAIAAAELDWDAARTADEIARVLEFYSV
jgi:glycerol-3-phosphate dehydrogenase